MFERFAYRKRPKLEFDSERTHYPKSINDVSLLPDSFFEDSLSLEEDGIKNGLSNFNDISSRLHNAPPTPTPTEKMTKERQVSLVKQPIAIKNLVFNTLNEFVKRVTFMSKRELSTTPLHAYIKGLLSMITIGTYSVKLACPLCRGLNNYSNLQVYHQPGNQEMKKDIPVSVLARCRWCKQLVRPELFIYKFAFQLCVADATGELSGLRVKESENYELINKLTQLSFNTENSALSLSFDWANFMKRKLLFRPVKAFIKVYWDENKSIPAMKLLELEDEVLDSIKLSKE